MDQGGEKAFSTGKMTEGRSKGFQRQTSARRRGHRERMERSEERPDTKING
jgi:hypothetical protein